MNKKIVYITRNDISVQKNIGFTKKIYSQIDAFNEYFDTDLLCTKGNQILLIDTRKNVIIYKKRYRSRLILHLLYNIFMLKVVIKFNYKCVYVRYKITDYSFYRFLKKITNQKVTSILEFPNFPYGTTWHKERIERRIGLYIDKAYRKKLRKYVTFTVNYNYLEFTYGIKSIPIRNGVTLTDIKLTERPLFKDKFVLISVASIGMWHALDRVIEGIEQYLNERSNNKSIRYHVVGDGPVLSKLKKMVIEKKLTDNVIFHGFVEGSKLYDLYSQSHVAVGALGLHRKNVFSCSAIKHREYCAIGIPFIYSSFDMDFDNSFPYALKVSENDEPIRIEKVIKFYNNLKDYKTEMNMRQYAYNNLTWEKQLTPVIEEMLKHIECSNKKI